MGNLYALDFDGVLCNSVGETAISCVKAAKLRWPEVFATVDSALEDWFVCSNYVLRPVVETGYETLLIVRLLLEIKNPSLRTSSVANGLIVEGILKSWFNILPVVIKEWNENRGELINLFDIVRDEWVENDVTAWLGANRIFPGVPDALKFSGSELYIVATKRGRFADLLLPELAGVTIPSQILYALGSRTLGTKADNSLSQSPLTKTPKARTPKIDRRSPR